MTYNSLPWELRLVNQAREALDQLNTVPVPRLDTNLLRLSRRTCNAITRRHSRTFHLASALLPKAKRQAARALYAFCRVSDDIIDHNPQGEPGQELDNWRRLALGQHPDRSHPVLAAWMEARLKYRIPLRYAEQLLDGVASDLAKGRYQTFDELAGYAYSVASTVGLMAMCIIGFSGQEAIPYAVKLGIALQMTNILRDVGEDWRNGRLYLPQEDLERFGISEADIAAGRVTPAWREFMLFQIKRVRRLFAEAFPGIGMLHADGRFAIAAAACLYEAILDAIEAQDYDVFSRRAHVSGLGKLLRLPAIWLKAQRKSYNSKEGVP